MPAKKTSKKVARAAKVNSPGKRAPKTASAKPKVKTVASRGSESAAAPVSRTSARTSAASARKPAKSAAAKTSTVNAPARPARAGMGTAASSSTSPAKPSGGKTAKPTPGKPVSSKRAQKPVAPEETVPSNVNAPHEVSAVPADVVDSQLAKYRSMRDFAVTAEPAGSGPAPKAPSRPASRARSKEGGLPFVIQKHAASHLHYDFRLGWSGVLKSWAVAKGPSYVVADKRLAVQVEDHPMEYGGFEGVIPKGQYGGGTVMVWDQGTWFPQPGHENVDAGLRTGSLKFELHGTKLEGKWTLVRMHTTKPYGGSDGDQSRRWRASDKPQWLLIKEHDTFERPATAPAIVDEAPDSALTGRTMEQIAAQSDHVWNSKETATAGQAWYRQENSGDTTSALPDSPPSTALTSATKGESLEAAEGALRILPRPRPASQPGPKPRTGGTLSAAAHDLLDELPREPQPEFIQPQLAQETEQPPEGSGWLHELKLDGYRMQARKSPRGVQMLTRSGLDWTYRAPAVAEAVAKLPFDSVTLDGEVVVLQEDGNTSFAQLQASFQNAEQHPLHFFCFDLLHLEGRNTRNAPLRDRKRLLAEVLSRAEEEDVLRLSEHLETSGQVMFEEACRFHAEGIISKRADDPYQTGRRSSWLKSKCLHEQEFVVGGFSPSSDGPDRIGSLLLGYYREGKLIFAGRTGTGFTQKQRKDLRTQLAPLESKSPAFTRVPADQRRDANWVRPELVAQVRFATWTADDLVRQAAFLGLREDKRPEEVVREDAAPLPKSNQPRTAAASSDTRVPALPARGKEPPSAAPAPVRLTHPKKILDPESGLNKQQLADYYWAVSERMLPHIADRPLSLVRCPDGAGKPCFYQKHVNSMLPPGIGSVMVADKKGGAPEPYITLNNREALAGLAQMGVLEVHPWGSCNTSLECPDRLIFDLDPDETLAWSVVASAALEVRERLKKIGLRGFLKTTGGKGLHIVSPIVPRHDFATVKDFAHRFVEAMERANPRLYLTRMTKSARAGKIYLDYLRNERGATAVAPFSPRARSGVNVSMPLDWKELEETDRPTFNVASFDSWKDRLRRDPWKDIGTIRQELRLDAALGR